MSNPNFFGYTVSQPRGINLDANDMEFARQLVKREPSVRLCIGCGGCTGTCSAGNLTRFHPRRLHLLIVRGEYRHLSKEINKCMLCGKCTLVCPRGVNIRNIILAVRSLL